MNKLQLELGDKINYRFGKSGLGFYKENDVVDAYLVSKTNSVGDEKQWIIIGGL